MQELDTKIKRIDPSKTVDVGGYRLDADGNYQQKTVSQAKSEVHLSELIDEVCEQMDDYVRATWKTNGTLTILKLITDAGMNPDMSNVDIIQDDDLNKSLKFYVSLWVLYFSRNFNHFCLQCEGIMEELEDNIIRHYQSDSKDIHLKVCAEEAQLCKNVPSNVKQSDEL